MAVQRARSAEEYADWVKQAKFEAEDLRECFLYDLQEIGGTGGVPGFLEPLVAQIDQVYQSMCNGEYSFGREDLSFVEILDKYANDIPFYLLLRQINETHRYGLDVGDD